MSKNVIYISLEKIVLKKDGGIILAIGDIIVGIDIGTTKVCLSMGEVNNFGQIEIICCTSYKCNGFKKGKIVDEDDISLSISKAIKQAEDETELKINSAYVTILGKYVTIVQNNVLKEVKDKFSGISQKDLQNAIMQVKDIEIPDNKILIDVALNQVMLDSGKIVTDPVGSFASSFTLSAQVILAEKDYVRKLNSVFKKAGLDIDGIVPLTLAERNLVLDKNELYDNVMLLDVGAGNTDIGVFEGNSFKYTNTVPLGGNNITHDIALVLDISEGEAEKLKRQYGLALRSFIDNDNEIMLNTCKDESKSKVIKSSELIEIMEARIEEIEKILKNAEVVVEDEVDLDRISVGCKVKVYDYEFEEEMELKLVGSTEANSLEGKISNESPVGKALIGAHTGDVVEVEMPMGIMKYKVLEIQRNV